MTDNPDEARNIGVIAGRDDKGHPLTQEQVDERTAKKLEADAERSEKVKQQLKKESDEATKAAEAQAKADEEFVKKQKAEREKAEAKAVHPTGAKAAANEHK
jgi:hypothetical protein